MVIEQCPPVTGVRIFQEEPAQLIQEVFPAFIAPKDHPPFDPSDDHIEARPVGLCVIDVA
jgi:hypothetical protein